MKIAKWHIYIFIAITVHLLFLKLGISYFEEGGDTFIKNTLSGVFTGGVPSFPPFSFGGHFVLSYFYLQLYKLFNNVMWYDLFTIVYSIISLVLVFESFHFVLKKKSVFLPILLGLLICLDSVLMLELTRISLTIAISSSFLILSRPIAYSKKKQIILQLLLCLSIFIRIESFFLASFLMLFILILKPEHIRNLKLMIPAFSLSIILSIALNVDWTTRDQLYNDIRPYQFVLLDFETKMDDAFQSKEDSVTMELAKIFFLNDPERINPEFLANYLAPLDKNPLKVKDYFTSTNFDTTAISKKLKRISYKYLLWCLACLVFIFYLILRGRSFKKPLLVFILYSLVLCGVFFLMKMENRILLPTSIGLVLILLSVQSKNFFPGLLIAVSILFLALPNSKYQELQARFGSLLKIENKLKEMPDDGVVVLDMHGSVWYGRKPFYKHEIKQKLVCLDNALLFMTPEYQNSMLELFGTNETSEVLNILGKQANTLFIGDMQRAIRIKNYFNQLYGFSFKIHTFEKIDSQTSLYQLN